MGHLHTEWIGAALNDAERRRAQKKSDAADKLKMTKMKASLLRQRDRRQTPEEEAGEHIGWCESQLDAHFWFSLSDLEPVKATMLLCGHNPNKVAAHLVSVRTNDGFTPQDYLRLLQRFEDLAKCEPQRRSLLQWHQFARASKLRYHPWIDEYVNAAGLNVDDAVGAEQVAPVLVAQKETASNDALEAPADTVTVPTKKAGDAPADPPPLSTPRLAEAFDDTDNKSAKQWRRILGDVNNHHWLLDARADRGTAPRPTTWWPLKFAALLEKRGVTFDSLNRAFLTSPTLKPWLRHWQEARRERNAFGQ
jgi:hypothetical protein